MLILKIRSKDRSLVALDSSYTGIAEYPNNCGSKLGSYKGIAVWLYSMKVTTPPVSDLTRASDSTR
jgi:hypothetical protein